MTKSWHREPSFTASTELLIWRVLAGHEGDIASVKDSTQRMKERMADMTQAKADLAAQVDATLGEIAGLEGEVQKLKDAIAASPGSAPEIQAAADAIEAQVARLKGAMPTVPPAPATPTTTAVTPLDPSSPPSDAAAPPTP